MSASSDAPSLPQPPSEPTATAATSASPTLHPQQLSVPLPLSPHTTLHVQITPLQTSTMVFLTTTDPSSTSSLSALGSFVYSMPNRLQPSEPLSTPLYAVPGSIDFATRVAKILARRTGLPAYVGCSAVFGGSVIEEEMAAVRLAVEGVMGVLGEGKR
ncbi:hypothetical protein HO133_006724 [Letharia lupina]|uniref:Uncharacterized protein n=1 Tax=Letharia lupina TaxID=560253 RepID=A0A8H6C5X5_9LECA|nr:uncharacterized protein HO133_006724 [Letharia lupina]KAF6217622.1 hypothetical protein HO133_006724 [Letharia lupina]